MHIKKPHPLSRMVSTDTYIIIVVIFMVLLDESLSSVTEARASMLYNLATVFCVMKEHDKAKQALQKVSVYE